jgi:hypothetical protein
MSSIVKLLGLNAAFLMSGLADIISSAQRVKLNQQ